MKTKNRTVYILDDDKEIHLLYQRFLRDLPLSLIFFDDSKAFLETIKNQPCDLIILDIGLKNHQKEGIFLLGAIKKGLRSNVKIMMATGNNSPEIAQEAYELGVDDFFTKPINKALLIEKVITILGLDSSQNSSLGIIDEDKSDLQMTLEVEIHSFSEHGIYFSSPYLFKEGQLISLHDTIINQITKTPHLKLLIRTNQQESAVGSSLAYATWDLNKMEILELKKTLKRFKRTKEKVNFPKAS